jgi:hypothetical protein
MYQLIGAAFWLAAGIFLGSGDPFVGLLAGFCALVWLGTTPSLAPLRPRKPTMLIRME